MLTAVIVTALVSLVGGGFLSYKYAGYVIRKEQAAKQAVNEVKKA